MTPWTVAYQAPLSVGFSRQEYWSGLPFLSPKDLPEPGIEPRSPALEADALLSEPPGKPLGEFKTLLWVLWFFAHLRVNQGEGNGNLLQYSCLETTMEGGAG